jgi:putative membrane protein
MKKVGIHIICNFTSIWLVTALLTGVKIRGGFLSYFLLATLLAVVNLGIKPILKFLTLPINLLTLGIFNLILDCLLLYALKFIVPGFYITEGKFVGIETSFFIIPSWNLNTTATVIIATIIFGSMTTLIEWLLKS